MELYLIKRNLTLQELME